MALPNTYDARDAQVMMELGYLAGSNLSTLFLPNGWDLIQTFAASFANGGAQGYFAAGTMPSTGERIAVMAVGAPWPSTMAFFGRSEHRLVDIKNDQRVNPSLKAFAKLNGLFHAARIDGCSGTAEDIPALCQAAELEEEIAAEVSQALTDFNRSRKNDDGDDANRLHDVASQCHAAYAQRRMLGGPQVDLGFSLLFNGIEEPLLEALAFTAGLPEFRDHLPLVATGMNCGAPLSQLAALKVRPGDNSPVGDIVSYSFSNPPYGNAAFDVAFKKAIPNTWRVLGSVDLFPSQPNSADGYVPTGFEEALPLAQPEYSSPWLERSQPYYNTGFVGLPQFTPSRTTNNGQQTALPEGYDPQLAYTMSLLTTVANQRFQTPGLPIRANTSPFTFNQDIRGAGITWAAAYSSATDEIAVAFRSTATWLELINVVNRPTLDRWTYGGDTRASLSRSLNELYTGLRDELRTWLATQELDAKKVLFTGSGAGGALAAIAALDFQQNPLPNAKGVAGVYSFGGTPVGTFRFQQMYDGALGNISYMVNRPLDIMPNLPLAGGFQPIGQIVHLTGGDFDPFNTLTFHPIFVYIQILNPFKRNLRRPSARLSPTSFSSVATEHMHRSAKFHRIDWSRAVQGKLSTNPRDERPMRISWLADKSDIPPVAQIGNHQVIYAVEELAVYKGAPLLITSPYDEPLILSCAKLQIQGGAQIIVEGPVRLDIGAWFGPTSGENAEIILRSQPGNSGIAGQDGVAGAMGPKPAGPGSPGGNGGGGSPGGQGGKISDALFHVGTVEGLFLIEQNPGDGGPGGAGGNGGKGGRGGPGGRGSINVIGPGGPGGNGGHGGPGGRGGDGGEVRIIYRELGPGGRFEIVNNLGRGGPGGQGGKAGIPGLGRPDGTMGSAGSPGSAGPNGRLGSITTEKGP